MLDTIYSWADKAVLEWKAQSSGRSKAFWCIIWQLSTISTEAAASVIRPILLFLISITAVVFFSDVVEFRHRQSVWQFCEPVRKEYVHIILLPSVLVGIPLSYKTLIPCLFFCLSVSLSQFTYLPNMPCVYSCFICYNQICFFKNWKTIMKNYLKILEIWLCPVYCLKGESSLQYSGLT